jgi:hypothetical protein
MSIWRPASRERVEAILEEHLRECTDTQRAQFDQIRIPSVVWSIERSGRTESVFVVGRVGDSLLFWEDIEEGFELAVPDDDGVLRQYGASQFDLSHLMYRLHDGQGLTADSDGRSLRGRR